jgi:hypothetical protein
MVDLDLSFIYLFSSPSHFFFAVQKSESMVATSNASCARNRRNSTPRRIICSLFDVLRVLPLFAFALLALDRRSMLARECFMMMQKGKTRTASSRSTNTNERNNKNNNNRVISMTFSATASSMRSADCCCCCFFCFF